MRHSGQLKHTTPEEQTQAPAYQGPEVASDWFVDPVLPSPATPAHHNEDPRPESPQHPAEDEQVTAFEPGDSPRRSQTVTALDQAPSRRVVAPANPVEPSGAEDGVWLGIPAVADGNMVEGELAWQVDALCAQTDPEAFFPEKGGSTREAKKVCSACTVKQECLDYALQNDERFGIWGGLSERERRKLKRQSS